MTTSAALLQELVRQVRDHTLQLLKATPPAWLRWAPEGTQNHILWHAGHALWVQDVESDAPFAEWETDLTKLTHPVYPLDSMRFLRTHHAAGTLDQRCPPRPRESDV